MGKYYLPISFSPMLYSEMKNTMKKFVCIASKYTAYQNKQQNHHFLKLSFVSLWVKVFSSIPVWKPQQISASSPRGQTLSA